jgi:hypothetical protein
LHSNNVRVFSFNFRLLELVKKYGTKHWTKVSDDLGGTKTRTQCRNRFQSIYKRYLKNPGDFNLAKIKNSTLQQRRQDELYTKLDGLLDKFLRQQKSARNEEEARGFTRNDFHITPDGVSIPKQDLYQFMFDLKQKLPSESSQLSYLDEEGRPPKRKRVTAAVRGTLGLKSNPRSTFVVTGPNGKVKTSFKNKVGRPAQNPELDMHTKCSRLDRALTQFFRPSWAGLANKRNKSEGFDKYLNLGHSNCSCLQLTTLMRSWTP